jgi:hypothetical protein
MEIERKGNHTTRIGNVHDHIAKINPVSIRINSGTAYGHNFVGNSESRMGRYIVPPLDGVICETNLLRTPRIVGDDRAAGDEDFAAVGGGALDVYGNNWRCPLIAVVVGGYRLEFIETGVDICPSHGVRDVGGFADFVGVGIELDLGD